MERRNPNKAKKYVMTKYHSVYDRGKTQIDKSIIVKEKNALLTDIQAKTLNSQFNNTGVQYIPVIEEEKKKGRPKKEETKKED